MKTDVMMTELANAKHSMNQMRLFIMIEAGTPIQKG